MKKFCYHIFRRLLGHAKFGWQLLEILDAKVMTPASDHIDANEGISKHASCHILVLIYEV
jgi:hypothetical protein